MTIHIIEALRAASRLFRTATWTQPRDSSLHRDRVAKAVLENDSEYLHHFEYPDIDLTGYVDAVRSVEGIARETLPDALLTPVRHHIEAHVVRAVALASGDDDQYQAAAVSLDGLPGSELVAYAVSVLADDAPATVTAHGCSGAQELAKRFETALKNYDLDHWDVQISADMSARMSVNGPLRRLRIRADATFSPAEADRLLTHEIGGHVLRWENAARQPEPLALLTLGSTVATEEGLALRAEYEAGLLDTKTLRTYAARVLAVQMSQTQGLLQIASALHEYVDLPAAAEIAIRVKRGLRNPNNPGGLTKDWGYLGGLRMMHHLAYADPTGLQLLRGIKWSIQHLPLAKQLQAEGRLQVPELSPDPDRLGIIGAT
ncbi:tyrosine/phenylalanine carboxypeptidase domain-containing protein (plasmid) [Arthrobacter sp. G.S.26]|uniref:tyrosine/phenylalanine carboxypeptidase domain-containing protein n=1 Tax=Arthrobacter sp. G.S.26 TaxID=3433706 RepID=UPI003D78790D